MTRTSGTACDTSRAFDWPTLLERAAEIVDSYDTLVTLRQLFYRLVAAELLPNTTNAYKALSRHTAQARREGLFPALMDRGRQDPPPPDVRRRALRTPLAAGDLPSRPD